MFVPDGTLMSPFRNYIRHQLLFTRLVFSGEHDAVSDCRVPGQQGFDLSQSIRKPRIFTW